MAEPTGDTSPRKSELSKPPTAGGERNGAASNGNTIRWQRAFVTAFAVVFFGGAAAGVIWYVANIEPPLYPVKGVVLLDGAPMSGGALLTFRSDGWSGALAAIGDDGRFEVTTNGQYGARPRL